MQTAPATSTDSAAAPPAGSTRFYWLMAGLGGWLIGVLYLDGWAHIHLPGLETFFTPWHAVLYSGMQASLLVLLYVLIRNVLGGLPARAALPKGYGMSLVGALLFAVGCFFSLEGHAFPLLGYSASPISATSDNS